MLTYKDIEMKYRLHFPEEMRESAVDIFNNSYTIDMVQDDPSRLYIFGLKKLYVYEDEKDFLDIMDQCIKKENKDAYIGLINYYTSKKSFIKALEYCKLLEKDKYKLDIIYNAIGVIYHTMKEPDTFDIIMEYFKKSIGYGCDSAKENIAKFLMENKKYAEAIEYYTDMNIKTERIYYAIGFCYCNLNNMEKSLDYIDLAGDYGYILRSLHLYKNKQHKEVCDMLLPVLKSDNIDENTMNVTKEIIIDICTSLEDYDAIIKILEPMKDKNTMAKRCLARAYMGKNDFKKAYDYLNEAHKEGDWQASNALLKIICGGVMEEKE